LAVDAPGEAFARAVRTAASVAGGWVFVTGSLYLVGEIRALTS